MHWLSRNLRIAGRFRDGIRLLTDRELAIFALIAAEQGVGRIAENLGISRTTMETHCEHIKLKFGYHNADALKQGHANC